MDVLKSRIVSFVQRSKIKTQNPEGYNRLTGMYADFGDGCLNAGKLEREDRGEGLKGSYFGPGMITIVETLATRRHHSCSRGSPH